MLTDDDGRMLQDRKAGLSELGAPGWHARDDAVSVCSSAIEDARRGLEALQQADGHWVFDLEADATIPAALRPARALPGRDRPGARRQDCGLSARDAGGSWRLVAVCGRGSQPQRDRQGLLCAQADRRRSGRAAHGAGACGNSRPRRRGPLQRVSAVQPRIVRPVALARGAGDAGRDHAVAALVSVPSGQGVLLVARPHRPVHDPDGAQAPRAQSARHRHPGVVRHAAGARAPLHHQSDRVQLGARAPGVRPDPARGRAVLSPAHAPAGDPPGGRVHHRAPERRGWAGRHSSADGRFRDGVRYSRLPQGPSGPGDCQAGGQEAGRRQWRFRLLPALCVAGVGYGAGLPCPDGDGRHRRDTDRPTRARLDRRAPGPGCRRRLGQGAARPASRRLGVRVPERPLSRRRRHRSDPVRAAPRRPGALSELRSSEASNGCSACNAATAAGGRSMPTTPTTI